MGLIYRDEQGQSQQQIECCDWAGVVEWLQTIQFNTNTNNWTDNFLRAPFKPNSSPK